MRTSQLPGRCDEPALRRAVRDDPPVEELVLGSRRQDDGALPLPEDWRGDVNPGLCRALLASFRCVGTLRVHVALAADVKRALWPGLEERPFCELLLSALRELMKVHD